MTSERVQRQIDRLLDEAGEALAQRDWGTVRDRVQDALALDPDNADARGFLAAAERALGSGAQSTPAAGANAPEPPPSTDVPTSFAGGKYQVEKPLGEGGLKSVYLARDTQLDRDVAFKLIKTEGLDEQSRTRVAREAQAMVRLGAHPHVVTVFELLDHEGQPYVVEELMGGGDVGDLIEAASDGHMAAADAIAIAQAVCDALEFSNSQGIVHRDLKPGSIWLTSDGVAKIGDVGLAVSSDRSRLTQEGMMVGTPFYMPPEQATGGEVTPQADLYSLGAPVRDAHGPSVIRGGHLRGGDRPAPEHAPGGPLLAQPQCSCGPGIPHPALARERSNQEAVVCV